MRWRKRKFHSLQSFSDDSCWFSYSSIIRAFSAVRFPFVNLFAFTSSLPIPPFISFTIFCTRLLAATTSMGVDLLAAVGTVRPKFATGRLPTGAFSPFILINSFVYLWYVLRHKNVNNNNGWRRYGCQRLAYKRFDLWIILSSLCCNWWRWRVFR